MSEDTRPSIAEIPEHVADQLRLLNHMTMHHEAIRDPEELYRILGSLALSVQRLPQLFAQLAKWLRTEEAAGRIAHDSGGDPSEYARSVGAWLTGAVNEAIELRDELEHAHQEAAGLKASEAPPRVIGGLGLTLPDTFGP